MSDLTLETPIRELLSKLLTWEDHINALTKLQEVDGMVNWYRADILTSAIDRFGFGSLTELAQVINLPLSTVTALVRTSRAFPPDKRKIGVPFYLHQQASFVDSYNERTKEFSGEERFALMDRVVEEFLSYREIAQEVRNIKEKRALIDRGENRIICASCGKHTGNLFDFQISSRTGAVTSNAYYFYMHLSCYEDYIALLKQKWDKYA